MTGEVSLRGGVMPIGGLPEKLMAAQRAGIKTVFIPYDNQRRSGGCGRRSKSRITYYSGQTCGRSTQADWSYK